MIPSSHPLFLVRFSFLHIEVTNFPLIVYVSPMSDERSPLSSIIDEKRATSTHICSSSSTFCSFFVLVWFGFVFVFYYPCMCSKAVETWH